MPTDESSAADDQDAHHTHITLDLGWVRDILNSARLFGKERRDVSACRRIGVLAGWAVPSGCWLDYPAVSLVYHFYDLRDDLVARIVE
jgi:hypothetical protein